MSQIDDAVALFAEGFNCAQAVLTAFGPAMGIERDACLRIAAGFGGGMGRSSEACGAVTGALMVIGLRYGSPMAGDREAKDRTYGMVREFIARFRARNGSINCTGLLGVDLGTPEGFQAAMARKIHTDVCPKFVRDAAEMLDELFGSYAACSQMPCDTGSVK